MKKELRTKMKALITGVCCSKEEKGKRFRATVTFELMKSPAFEYGNRLAMRVSSPGWHEDHYVDCRYAGTSDITKLAKAWADSYFGENMRTFKELA